MLIIGHRGCYDEGYNQNTIRAMRHVIDRGARAIEFDVQRTSDNALVIVHDLNLAKVSTGSGLVAERPLSEIRGLLAGDPKRGQDRIPTLEEVFGLAAEYAAENRPRLHVELKGQGTGALAGKLIRQEIDSARLSSFLVSSFLWDEVDVFRRHCPEVDIALLAGALNRERLLAEQEGIGAWLPKFFAYPEEKFMLPLTANAEKLEALLAGHDCPAACAEVIRRENARACSGSSYDRQLVEEAVRRGAVSINLWHVSVNKAIVDMAHAAGLKVLAYTVNTFSDARRLEAIAVDGIFSDHYPAMREFL
ncbi:MAG: glycerophosphodiester phosphodiesterase [Salinispira sp.]